MATATPTVSPAVLQELADSAENQAKIANAGRIPQIAFIASIGVFFGLAVLAVLVRTIGRFVTRRRFYLDDGFVVFALICLCAGTGLLIHFYRLVFVDEAAATNPTVVVAPEQYTNLFESLTNIDAYFSIMWTSTFSIKASFLALFKPLIRRLSRRIVVFYWCAVVLTLLSWGYFVSEVFIVCHYFGAKAVRCLPQPPYLLSASLTGLGSALDIITDLMIVSIPIMILHQTQMKCSQKASLGSFLCLSIVMVCITLVRAAGFDIGKVEDVTWDIYWVFMEACVACIMASIAVYRTVFDTSRSSRGTGRQRQGIPYSGQKRIVRRTRRWRNSPWEEVDADNSNPPNTSSAKLPQIPSFIRKNDRNSEATTVTQASLDHLVEVHKMHQISK